jgi:hypothetical protein
MELAASGSMILKEAIHASRDALSSLSPVGSIADCVQLLEKRSILRASD